MSRAVRNVRVGASMLVEKLLRWCISPHLRAALLRLLGAQIGRNVRIYEIKLINPVNGFRNLKVQDNVHVGPGTIIDLTGTVIIGERSTISPRVIILTHSDAGEDHESAICKIYPRRVAQVVIGSSAWIGAGTIVQAGVEIGDRAVIGAGSVVAKDVPSDSLACGVPAQVKRRILAPQECQGCAKN